MPAERIAGSITNIFPLLSWTQRDLLHELLKPHGSRVSPAVSAVLTRLSDFFDPVRAVTLGVERCAADVQAMLDSLNCDGLGELQRELADRCELLNRPNREPDVSCVVLQCLSALVRVRRSDLGVVAA